MFRTKNELTVVSVGWEEATGVPGTDTFECYLVPTGLGLRARFEGMQTEE